MLQQQISLSPDLKGLRDKGYQIEVCDGHLFAHHIPYLNTKGELKLGSLVSTLDLSGTKTAKPSTHVIMFCGEEPCDKSGKVLMGIKHSNTNKAFSNGLNATLTFSNKPANGYTDYLHKITNYASIISGPAKSFDESVTERPYKPIVEEKSNSIFITLIQTLVEPI